MICFLRRARACLATGCLVLAVGTPAIGQTLKATAPVLTSPATGAQLDTRRPALTVSNAVGIFVPAIFNYRFQIFLAEDPEVVVVSAVVPHTNGHTVFTPPADLEFETTYVWSARAELDGAVGPESTSFSFRTPAAPPPIGPLGFTCVSAASGVAVQILGGHGAMFADATGDLGPDLYITMNFNDPVAELFFVNQGTGTFTEAGAVRGVADFDVGTHGAAFADLDNDGDYDLINGATGSSGAPNNIFVNVGSGFFNDVTPASMSSRAEPTRGLLAFDMDRDGDLDVFGVTGWMGSGDPPGERNELYRNDGNFQFTAMTSGLMYTAPAGQGATDTDFNGDGDIDIIAANRDGDLNILRNDGALATSAWWTQIRSASPTTPLVVSRQQTSTTTAPWTCCLSVWMTQRRLDSCIATLGRACSASSGRSPTSMGTWGALPTSTTTETWIWCLPGTTCRISTTARVRSLLARQFRSVASTTRAPSHLRMWTATVMLTSRSEPNAAPTG